MIHIILMKNHVIYIKTQQFTYNFWFLGHFLRICMWNVLNHQVRIMFLEEFHVAADDSLDDNSTRHFDVIFEFSFTQKPLFLFHLHNIFLRGVTKGRIAHSISYSHSLNDIKMAIIVESMTIPCFLVEVYVIKCDAEAMYIARLIIYQDRFTISPASLEGIC